MDIEILVIDLGKTICSLAGLVTCSPEKSAV